MKIFKVMLIVLCLALIGRSVTNAAPGNVRFTVHNLSNNDDTAQGLGHSVGFPQRTFFSLSESQVCIFCHTPHNAKPAAPLWNKASLTAATSFKMYSSESRSSAVRNATLAGSVSLLCLSCHDGKTAINVLHNASSGVAAPGEYDAGSKVVELGGIPGPVNFGFFGSGTSSPTNIGGTDSDPYAGNDLTNDHPIGFSYTAAQSASGGKLRPIGSFNNKIRFFGADNRLECSSCHDPHVNYAAGPGAIADLRPFLVMSNVGSDLCLQCHNK